MKINIKILYLKVFPQKTKTMILKICSDMKLDFRELKLDKSCIKFS